MEEGAGDDSGRGSGELFQHHAEPLEGEGLRREEKINMRERKEE